MRLEFRDGLIFTSLSITYKGKTKKIESIVLDTGAAQSIVSPDAVEELGITVEPDDIIVTCYGIGGKQYAVAKRVNGISFGPFKLCSGGFGNPNGFPNSPKRGLTLTALKH